MRRVYFGEYRFSEDLDFTLMRDLTLDAIFSAFDEVFFALERKPVLGTYDEFSDLPSDRLLQVYSFPEIVVEKTLAVTDGARREPRDLYDLWYISNEGHIPHWEDLIDGLNRKLTSREGRSDDVLASRLEQVEKTLKQRWNLRLRAQVMNLPEFDGCYRDVKRLLSDFDKLRGE